jgi:hypothetical protein
VIIKGAIGFYPKSVVEEIKSGILRIFVPGTPDEVKEKSGISCKMNLENTQPTFVLLAEEKSTTQHSLVRQSSPTTHLWRRRAERRYR